MLSYKAMYKYLDQGVHAQVLAFPGVISVGKDLDDARRMLASALVDIAETNLKYGEALPRPDASFHDAEAYIEEPIHLVLRAASRVTITPQTVAA